MRALLILLEKQFRHIPQPGHFTHDVYDAGRSIAYHALGSRL